jgi:uncharacterized protein
VGKVLVWVVIGLAVMMVARLLGLQKSPPRVRTPGRPGKPPAAKTPKELEHMVRCAHCGIYLPRSEALLIGGHIFCGREHAERGVSPVNRAS